MNGRQVWSGRCVSSDNQDFKTGSLSTRSAADAIVINSTGLIIALPFHTVATRSVFLGQIWILVVVFRFQTEAEKTQV